MVRPMERPSYSCWPRRRVMLMVGMVTDWPAGAGRGKGEGQGGGGNRRVGTWLPGAGRAAPCGTEGAERRSQFFWKSGTPRCMPAGRGTRTAGVQRGQQAGSGRSSSTRLTLVCAQHKVSAHEVVKDDGCLGARRLRVRGLLHKVAAACSAGRWRVRQRGLGTKLAGDGAEAGCGRGAAPCGWLGRAARGGS